MSNPYRSRGRGLDSPAIGHLAIAPSDTSDLPLRPRVLYCKTAGTAVLRDGFGTEISYTLSAGQILPISPLRVLATGTTASLIGWW